MTLPHNILVLNIGSTTTKISVFKNDQPKFQETIAHGPELARISGMPDIERKSAFHALNQKTSARMAAQNMGISYAKSNMVVAHLGRGITVGAHYQGKVIDSTIGGGKGGGKDAKDKTLQT